MELAGPGAVSVKPRAIDGQNCQKVVKKCFLCAGLSPADQAGWGTSALASSWPPAACGRWPARPCDMCTRRKRACTLPPKPPCTRTPPPPVIMVMIGFLRCFTEKIGLKSVSNTAAACRESPARARAPSLDSHVALHTLPAGGHWQAKKPCARPGAAR